MAKENSEEEYELNINQEVFCRLYTGKWLGNATQAYKEAFGCEYDSAKTEWNKLLTKPYIKDAVRKLLDKNGFNDENIDAQHLFLVNQFEDLAVKARMVEHYNKLKQRVVAKIEITDKSSLQSLTDEELMELAEKRRLEASTNNSL